MANLEIAAVQAIRNLEEILRFGEDLSARSSASTSEGGRAPIIPALHQIIRIFFGIQAPGTSLVPQKAPRLAIADGTSSGKTYTATAIKAMRDLRARKKRKALVVAPAQVLSDAWLPREINHYSQSLNLPDGYSSQDVRRLTNRTIESAFEGDMVLVNYDKFSHKGPGGIHLCADAILRNVDLFGLLILDEVHNLKNPQSQRSNLFRQVVEATKDKPALLLSASPVPNRLSDAGYLLYLLDPDQYRHYSTSKFDYRKDSQAIRNAIITHPWFYFTRDEVKELFHLPELLFQGEQWRFSLGNGMTGSTIATPITIPDTEAEEYLNIWANTSSMGKIMRMRDILLRPKIEPIADLISNYLQSQPSGQFSVFTFLKEGFIEELKGILEQRGMRIGVISGEEKKVANRVQTAREFTSGKLTGLINTAQTVGEGIRMNTGDRPCLLIMAEPPIAPGEYDQIIGRHYRKGQTAPVTIAEVMSVLPDQYQSRMVEQRGRLERQGVRFRSRWIPSTLDQDRVVMRFMKERLFDSHVKRGLELSGIFEVVSEMNEASSAKEGGYVSLPRKRDLGSNLTFMQGVNKVRTYIGKPVEDLVNSPDMDALRRAYAADEWEQSSSADTDRLVAQIIKALEVKERRWLDQMNATQFDMILDWGCGPACLERILGRPVVNLDLDAEMLREGKLRTPVNDSGLLEGKRFISANMRMAPFKNKMFHIEVNVYGLQYNAQGFQFRRDIEEIFSEMNRTMIPGGYAIFGLPNQATSPEDFRLLQTALLPAYGFNPIFADYVKGYAPEEGSNAPVFQGAYILVAEKNVHRTICLEERSKDFKPVLVDRFPSPDGGLDPGEIIIFSPYKRVGAGGVVLTPCYEDRAFRKAKPKIPATHFLTSDGAEIGRVIANL